MTVAGLDSLLTGRIATSTGLAIMIRPFAVGIMVLLAVGTVGYLPLILPLLLPRVTVNSGKIAGWLFLLTLLPLPKHLFPESVGCFKNPSGVGYICP